MANKNVEPVLIVERVPFRPNRYRLLTGFRRFSAYKNVGMTVVEVMIEPEGVQKTVNISEIEVRDE